MSVKKGLSFQEHLDAALLMKQAYENVLRLEGIFSKAYGKTKEPVLSIKKTIKYIIVAKNEADEIFCKEIPPPQNSPYFGAIDKLAD